MKNLFWIALFGCIYSYAVYPALLRILPTRRRLRSNQFSDGRLPTVTLIIACRNEVVRLPHKIENALAVDYPGLDIVVASDASDDGSDEVIRKYGARGVRVVRSIERRGKEFAQGLAVAEAKGEVLVFSDAGTDLPVDSIRRLGANFCDPEVGAVSSEDRFVTDDGHVVGEGIYVKYEMWLRRLESQRAGLVGLSGSFFGVRRSVLDAWNTTIPSDFACALHTVRAGMRAVSDDRVLGIYRDIKDPAKEYSRKVRTAVRGMTAVAVMREVLNPFRYGLFAFQVWGHKIARWLVPWFMVLLLVSSVLLYGVHPIYTAALAAQSVVYGAALMGHLMPGTRRLVMVRLAYFFVQVNMALGQAGMQFLRGRRIVTWEPSAR